MFIYIYNNWIGKWNNRNILDNGKIYFTKISHLFLILQWMAKFSQSVTPSVFLVSSFLKISLGVLTLSKSQIYKPNTQKAMKFGHFCNVVVFSVSKFFVNLINQRFVSLLSIVNIYALVLLPIALVFWTISNKISVMQSVWIWT